MPGTGTKERKRREEGLPGPFLPIVTTAVPSEEYMFLIHAVYSTFGIAYPLGDISCSVVPFCY